MNKAEMIQRLSPVFPAEQAGVLAEVIHDAYNTLVKASDFSELKAIVAELAEAQKRTDQRLAELTEAQKRTDQRLAELTEAQKRTDQRLAELAEEQREMAKAQREMANEMRDLVRVVRGLATDLGGLSRTMSYSLENEAYRLLPGLLEQKFGLEVERKFVRTEINGEEINLLGWARQDGQPVLIVGESKLRLDMRWPERQEVFDQLNAKVEAVRNAYPGQKVIPVLITHYAPPAFVKEAESRGVHVFQSFEW